MLPGREYSPEGPLLFFGTHAALARGWDVRQVWWHDNAPERGPHDVTDEMAWVERELEAACEGYGGRLMVMAKSLGTLAAAFAAEHRYPAAWLTPLLTEPDVADALLSYPVEQFVVIGESDPYLDHTVFDALPGDRFIVPGDHVLATRGDAVAMVSSHDAFVRALDGWLAALA